MSYPTPPSFHLSAQPTVFSSLAHFWIVLTQENGSLLFCPAYFFSPLPFFFISLPSTYSFPLFIFLPLLFSPTCHAPSDSFVLLSSFSFLFLIPSSSLFFFFFFILIFLPSFLPPIFYSFHSLFTFHIPLLLTASLFSSFFASLPSLLCHHVLILPF